MKRSIPPTVMRAGAALLLALGAIISMSLLLASGAASALAAPAIVADSTPADTPTPFAVPTISAGAAASVTAAAPTTTGITIAAGLTCITTIIGLVIAIITLRSLLRGGYGPFLRALVFGSKARGAGGGASAKATSGQWDASHTLNYRSGPDAREEPMFPRGARDEFAGYDPYDQPGGSSRRSGSRGGSRSRRDERDARSGRRAERANAPSRARDGRRAPSTTRRNGWD